MRARKADEAHDGAAVALEDPLADAWKAGRETGREVSVAGVRARQRSGRG